jgi:hypothetical protein
MTHGSNVGLRVEDANARLRASSARERGEAEQKRHCTRKNAENHGFSLVGEPPIMLRQSSAEQ